MRKMPELNTTSTADISFMLLTFFLVTSSMDSDKGLPRQLPPMAQETEAETEAAVSRDNVMDVALVNGDRLLCDGKEVTLRELRSKVLALAKSKPMQHIISVKAAPQTSYDAYFKMQNTIVSAYNALRDREARKSYGHAYSECSDSERAVIAKKWPQRISEAEPDENEKGGDE